MSSEGTTTISIHKKRVRNNQYAPLPQIHHFTLMPSPPTLSAQPPYHPPQASFLKMKFRLWGYIV